MLHNPHLLLREGDGVPEDSPDDGLQEGRGGQGALVVVETLVLWEIDSDITDSRDSDSSDSDSSDSDSNDCDRGDQGTLVIVLTLALWEMNSDITA